MLTVRRAPGAVARSDVGRALRFANVLFGALVVAAPWVLTGATSTSRWFDLGAGTAIGLLSFACGPVGEKYGTWDRFIR